MIFKEVANILRKKGGFNCIHQAGLLENALRNSTCLHLRNLNLNEQDIWDITKIIQRESNTGPIISVSCSYNPLLGDAGAILIAERLPDSVSEIGLVDCGIGDEGGRALLKWMKQSQNLKMICVEENNLSDAVKAEFIVYRMQNPRVIVIY